MRVRYLIFLCFGSLLATQASADDGFFSDSRIRAGLAFGQVSTEGKKLNGFDEHSTGWQLFAGFEFNRYLAVEIGKFDIGSAVSEYAISGGTRTDKVEGDGFVASALASWPVNDVVSLYARGGIFNWDSTTKVLINGAIAAVGNDSGSDPYYGFGVGVNIDSGMVRLEYALTGAGTKVGTTKYEADVGYISLAILWRFGF